MKLFVLIFGIVFLNWPLWGEPLSENQARFGAITGDVGLLTQGAKEWIEPHEGLPIEPGDQIRTGEDGQAELILSGNVLWWIRPESDVVTDFMLTNSGRLSLTNGVLMGKVDAARAGMAQQWEFNTPAAGCAVRGTEFALDVSTSGTRLGVFEGEVEMNLAEGPSGSPPPVRIGARQEAVALRGKPVRTLNAWSPRMQAALAKRHELQSRFSTVQNTWSPFTDSVRNTLRSKYVKPVPKSHPRPRPARKRRSPSSSSSSATGTN